LSYLHPQKFSDPPESALKFSEPREHCRADCVGSQGAFLGTRFLVKNQQDRRMVNCWGPWKPFPNSRSGGHVEAPIGPGVYEVRHRDTGEVVAFGDAASVAHALAGLMPKPVSGLREALFGQKGIAYPSEQLEYRTCAARTPAEARVVADRLRSRRQVYWRSKLASGWA
jgi:hypothetical protein